MEYITGNFTSTGPAYFSDDLEVAGTLMARNNVNISGSLSLLGITLSSYL